jgi:hypothetical protein
MEEKLNTENPENFIPTLEDIEGKKKAAKNLAKSNTNKTSKKNQTSSLNIAKLLTNIFNGTFLTSERSVKQWPFVVFLAIIGMFYIANSYVAEKKVRKIEQLSKELKDLHSQYITSKAEIMFYTKQSEIAKLSEKYGMIETKEAPHKILMK